MAVNAATSSYVNNASSSKGFSGLASGVDTESMVEQLLSGTQSKIDKQQGLKQQLEWKQEIYRNIISQINSFQAKFFSYSSSTNLASTSFWNSMSVLANSTAFKATATSSASTGTSSISVRRLATKTSLTSGMSVSGNLSGKLDTEALSDLTKKQLDGDYTVKFKVGDTAVDVDLKDLFVSEDGKTFISYSSTTQQDNAIQKKLQAAFDAAETGVKVTVKDGEVSMVSKDTGSNAKNITVEGTSGALGLERLGLTANTGAVKTSEKKNNIETVTYTLSGKVDAVPKMEFSVTLDDLKKTITIDLSKVMDGDGNIDSSAFRNQLEAALTKAHGKDQVKVVDTPGGGFTLKVSAGRKVDVGGAEDVMTALGMKNGASNRISLGSKLSDLNLGTPLRGDSYRFTINGEEFHFTGDTAIIDVMDVINRSNAGVRMVYRAQDDKFILEAKEYGAGKQITMSQSEGNLLTALFGTGAGVTAQTSAASKRLSTYQPAAIKGVTFIMTKPGTNDDGDPIDVPLTAEEAELVKLTDLRYIKEYRTETDPNDPEGTIEVPVYGTLGELGDLEEIFPELFSENPSLDPADATLGDLIAAQSDGKANDYSYKLDDDGNLTITHNVTANTTLDDLGLTLGTYPGTTTLGELETLTDGKLRYGDNQFLYLDNGYYAETADAATAKTLEDLFGKGVALGREPGEFTTVDGQNSEVMIDGLITERSSNNFTVNGVNYDISEITGSYSDLFYAVKQPDGSYEYYTDETMGTKIDDPTDLQEILTKFPDLTESDLVLVDGEWKKFTGTSTTVTVKQDTDSIINALKEFVDEYNVLVKTLNDLLDEDTNYRDYQPLTSAQKAEMSDREIELWEQKAKEGLLHRDSTIQDFLQQMRTALYQKPAGCKYALYDLGIETGEWEMKGQLSFVGGDAVLRNFLENDPSGVASLFTGINGLGTTLNDILKTTASTSSGSPGTLVKIAGLKGSDKNSSMYEQMKKIDEKIEALKRQYEMEKTRYWNQFNTMEQMISNMNTQSAYLAQMMGMSY